MKKFIAVIAGCVFRHSPAFYERRRKKLSKRLHSVFDMDFIEGTLDCTVRSYLANN